MTHRFIKNRYRIDPTNEGFRQAALSPQQLRKMGMIYNVYRFLISIFLFLSSYAVVFQDNQVTINLPSFLYQTILLFYGVFSILIMGLFYVIPSYARRQLGFGLIFDIIILSLLLFISGTPDVQLVMLYVVVVAASFIMLAPYQAVVITLLAIIFIIYQQFFYALTNSLHIADLGNAVLLSISFLGVGFLSWYVTQQLAYVEHIAQKQASEVAKLNVINQQVIANMVQGVMVLNETLTLKLSNKSALTLLDLIDDIDDQTKIKQLYARHAELMDWLAQTNTYHPSTLYYQAEHRDASLVKLRILNTPLEDGSRLVMIEDIRREQTSAQQLKLASLGQLTASIAHEIRNPLAAISQASQLLLEDAQTSLKTGPEKQDDGNIELYEMIFAQTKRVNRIIEDVLNLSRQTKPNLIEFNLVEWIEKFLSEHFSQHDVFLHTHCNPVISFDTRQLEQILINLINNGLRYSSQSHPHAFVEIEINEKQNDIILDVLDTGVGVPAENQESLFHPFFTTDASGTGLGLYLSQAFSEANDAQLIYVPQHTKTCFRLLIPKVTT